MRPIGVCLCVCVSLSLSLYVCVCVVLKNPHCKDVDLVWCICVTSTLLSSFFFFEPVSLFESCANIILWCYGGSYTDAKVHGEKTEAWISDEKSLTWSVKWQVFCAERKGAPVNVCSLGSLLPNPTPIERMEDPMAVWVVLFSVTTAKRVTTALLLSIFALFCVWVLCVCENTVYTKTDFYSCSAHLPDSLDVCVFIFKC